MSLLNSFIRGDITLWKSYWVVGVIIPIPIGFVLGVLTAYLGLPSVFYKIILLMFLIYITIGVWRSADKYQGKKIFAILAKIGMGLGVLYALVNIL